MNPRFAIRLAALALMGVLSAGCPSDPAAGGGDDTDADVVEVGDDVTTACEDPDEDGYGPGCELGELDCQPSDPTANPGVDEVCGDLVDNDCDDEVDEGCACAEGRVEPCYTAVAETEGVGICEAGFRTCAGGAWTDCTDEVVPRAAEETMCDGLDEDCDGTIDEGLGNACGLCGSLPLEVCGDGLDNDCDGTIDEPDAGCDCDGRLAQPCYSGNPQTLGVGRCRGGAADCLESGEWGACVGELLPIAEVCDGLDNDCDGEVDEGLRNRCGVCGTDEPREVCDGLDNDCDGDIDEGLTLACGLCPGLAPEEECGDGLDNDCDGSIDEACSCTGADTCYPGPPETIDVGECRAGTRRCDATGEFWGPCEGYAIPNVEICDRLDNDCDGRVDIGPDGCNVCGGDVEICDGEDNDCDGLVDEGVRNACGDCIDDVAAETECDGLDNDCDGLVDEGLLNACGTCDESCYDAIWDEPEEWAVGQFDGVDSENTDAGLRLGAGRAAFPDLWVANTADGTVTRIDTDTASRVATFDVGRDPSRTAVDFDGNVFVANRAFPVEVDGAPVLQQGSVTRVLADGCEGEDCVAWTTDIGGLGDIPRGLAIDREGFAWAGTFNNPALYRLDPDSGEVVFSLELPVSVYGLAIDSEGIIWIATFNAPGLAAFDTNTYRYIGSWTLPECSSSYGVAVDGVGNVWLGAWNCDGLVRVDRSELDLDDASGTLSFERYTDPNMVQTRGVAVDGDGMVYLAASGTDRLGKFDPSAGEWLWTVPTCDEPIGVGIARDGNVWAVCRRAAEARRYSPDGDELQVVGTGRQPYSYSDMTGFQLRNFTAPSGTWTVEFDCGYPTCGFDSVSWDAAAPAGTAVRIRARSREAAEDAWGPWSSTIGDNPADISDQVGPGRFCQVEVALTTTDRAVTPVVTSVELGWQRP